ncbi:hypothetical protein D3C72_1509490 [compost metagenome]
MAQIVHAAELQTELAAIVGQAAQRHAAEADPVVGLLAADETRALAFATQAMMGQHDLHRRIHRLRARAGEEHVVEPRRGQRRQSLRQGEGRRRTHLEGGRVIERGGLLGDRVDDAPARVPCIAAPQARRAIKDGASIDVLVVHALGTYQHARRALVLAVGSERHPVRVQ